MIRRLLRAAFSAGPAVHSHHHHHPAKFVKAVLPALPYGYGELAPALSPEILEVHHAKHHQAYVNKYNEAAEKLLNAYDKHDAHEIADLGKALRFHAGGHVNHAIYWENLAPANKEGGDLPDKQSKLTQLVTETWGGYEQFIAAFNAKTADIQGSGWGWLAYDPKSHRLSIEETANQFIISAEGRVPLLVVDVWEHAYYLQYKNVRPDYLKKIWEVINWKVVEQRLHDASIKK